MCAYCAAGTLGQPLSTWQVGSASVGHVLVTLTDNLTINAVLCYLKSVRSTATKDVIVLYAVAFYTSDAILKAKNTIFNIYKQKPITRKACNSHPNPSTEGLKDILDLIDHKPTNIKLPTFVAQGHTSMPPLTLRSLRQL